jgi:hypothetical protein
VKPEPGSDQNDPGESLRNVVSDWAIVSAGGVPVVGVFVHCLIGDAA